MQLQDRHRDRSISRDANLDTVEVKSFFAPVALGLVMEKRPGFLLIELVEKQPEFFSKSKPAKIIFFDAKEA